MPDCEANIARLALFAQQTGGWGCCPPPLGTPMTKTLLTNTPTRDYNDRNLNNFQSCLSQVNWSSILTDQDPNEMFEIFVSEYSRHFEDCFLLKTIKHNNQKKQNHRG